MLETVNNTMELKAVSCTGLRGVLDFIYSGDLHLDQDNVMEVLSTASHLQVVPVIQHCSQFFITNLSLDNIKTMQVIAEIYHLKDLKEASQQFILKNFAKFAKTDYYKQLPLSEICKLLKDNNLRVHSELKVFKYVAEWVLYSRKNRESLASNLLKNIRLPYLTKDELESLLKYPFVKANRHCQSLIEKVIQFKEHPSEQIFHSTSYTQVRSEPYLLSFGCSDVAMHCCILYHGNWYPLDRAMGQPRPFIGAAALVLNNFIFVCGGQVAGNVTDHCHCFNPITCKWTNLNQMLLPRRNFAIASVGFTIYAIGGISTDNISTNTVEAYSVADDKWTKMPSLPDIALADMSACSWKNKIFVAAGVDENCIHTKEFRCLDLDQNVPEPKWIKKASLLQIKFRPAMSTTQDHIYLVDLYRTEGSLAHLNQYHVTTDQWSSIELSNIRFSRSFSAVMINDWIYFVGRNDVDDGPSKKYNVITQNMEDIKGYPWTIESPLCVSVRLPHKFLQRNMLKRVHTIPHGTYTINSPA